MRALSQVKELGKICKGLVSKCETLSTAQQFEIKSAIKLFTPWKKDATKQLHSQLQPIFAGDAPHLQSLLANEGCAH